MNNLQLQIFKNPNFGQVRVVNINGEAWLVGKDVADVLGYAEPRSVISKKVDSEDKGVAKMETPSGIQEMTIINESGFYSLVLSSKLPNAKKFRRWVTSEVLPSIRKHGGYVAGQEQMTPELILANAIKVANSVIDEHKKKLAEAEEKNFKLEHEVVGLNKKISELKPKADYVDRILKSTSLVTTTQIAKDYGMGAPSFNKKLKELKVQHKVGGQWVLTYKYQGKGYASSETIDIELEDGRIKTVMQTKWTQKGRLFLHDLLKKHNIVPLIEVE